ncbi:hypothetical protein GNF18_10310 [Ligilactobacillus pobuzihii]|nr:hypothetical protein [Ligilactobacillus pobuzihii]
MAKLNEWEKEPDHKEFKYKGYDCEINRTEEVGILCGYVIIDQNNKLFGFDCGHAGDYVPGMYPPYAMIFINSDDLGGRAGKYRNIQFVTDEIKKLVDQVAEYETAKGNEASHEA